MKIENYGPQIELEIQEMFEGDSGDPSGDIRDYEGLQNKPSINGVVLQGDKTFNNLGMTPLSNMEILQIINNATQ